MKNDIVFNEQVVKDLEAIADELEKRGEGIFEFWGRDDDYEQGRRMGLLDAAEYLRQLAEKVKQI